MKKFFEHQGTTHSIMMRVYMTTNLVERLARQIVYMHRGLNKCLPVRTSKSAKTLVSPSHNKHEGQRRALQQHYIVHGSMNGLIERERERFNYMSIRPAWPMRTSHCSYSFEYHHHHHHQYQSKKSSNWTIQTLAAGLAALKLKPFTRSDPLQPSRFGTNMERSPTKHSDSAMF